MGTPVLEGGGRNNSEDEDKEVVAVGEVTEESTALSKENEEVVLREKLELRALLKEMKEGLDEITAKLKPLIEDVKEGKLATKNGISYLEVKHLLLFSYCEALVFFILLKAEGRIVKDHPLWLRLVEIKMFLEKIRPIDKKLQYQIEKLLKAGKTPASGEIGTEAVERDDSLTYRPNPDLLVSKLDQMTEDGGGLYRPPMIAPAAMDGEENMRDRRSKVRAEKDMQRRASRSAFIRELANEVEGRPEEVQEVVGTESKEMIRDRARLEKRAEEEEELFARVPLSKADRKKVKNLKQAQSGLLGMLDDFEDDVVDLATVDDTRPGNGWGSLVDKSSKRRALAPSTVARSTFTKRSQYKGEGVEAPEELGQRSRKPQSKKYRK